MESATVLSRGRVTIPKRVRERLGATEAGTLVFEEAEGGFFVSRLKAPAEEADHAYPERDSFPLDPEQP